MTAARAPGPVLVVAAILASAACSTSLRPAARLTPGPDVTPILLRADEHRTPLATPSPSAASATVASVTPRPRPSVVVARQRPAAACPAPARAVAPPEGVSVRLQLFSTTVPQGYGVNAEVSVRNDGDAPVTWFRLSDQQYDLWAEGPDGLVWIWSQGREFTGNVVNDRLEPREDRRVSVPWNQRACPQPDGQRVPPGRYTMRALWRAGDGGWWSEPVAFDIT